MFTIFYDIGDTTMGASAYVIAVLFLFNEFFIGTKFFWEELNYHLRKASFLQKPMAFIRGCAYGTIGYLPLIIDLAAFFVIFVIFRAGNGDSEIKTQGMLATILISLLLKLKPVVKFIRTWGYNTLSQGLSR